MLLWSVLALFALGAVSEDTVTTDTVGSHPIPTPHAVNDPEPIPYSNGGGQVFETSDELIQSFRRQKTASPELPAVITSGQLRTKIPSKELEAPLETITHEPSTSSSGSTFRSPGSIESTITSPGSTIISPVSTVISPGSTISSSGSTISSPGSTITSPGSTITSPGSTITSPVYTIISPVSTIISPVSTISNPGSTISTSGSTITSPGSTITSPGSTITSTGSTISSPGFTISPLGSTISAPGSVLSAPPRPAFNRSLHLRDELIVPSSGYTEVYDISWHAETNTALTVVVDSGTFIFRIPQPDDQIQFLKNEETRALGSVQRICTKSPLIPASPEGKIFPGLPDMEPFQFLDFTNEDGRQIERWQHVIIGKPGEAGAVQGESLNFTHDFSVYRDGGYAVPLRYTVVTDSSILGPISDSYTHRYSLLPAPTGPILPDTAPMCTIWNEYEPESGRTENSPKKLDAKELQDILTPTLL